MAAGLPKWQPLGGLRVEGIKPQSKTDRADLGCLKSWIESDSYLCKSLGRLPPPMVTCDFGLSCYWQLRANSL